MSIGWLIAVLLGLLTLFYALTGDTSLIGDMSTAERWTLVGGLVASALLALLLLRDYSGRTLTALRHLALWTAIFIGLVALYAFREEIAFVGNRVAGELLPAGYGTVIEDPASGDIAVRIRQHAQGQFIARTAVNGASVTMLVDTGASTVVLKPADARNAGIDTDSLRFTIPVRTANGTTFAAPVRIRTLSVGPIRLDDVEALVAKPGNLNVSLLGMSFLRRLRSYEFSGSFLTLRS